MKISKSLIGYFFSIFIIPFCIFGFFYNNWIFINEKNIIFYIKLSSLFILVIVFLLSWYYSNDFIRRKTLFDIENFGKEISIVDSNKLSYSDINNLSDLFIYNIKKIEKLRFILYGFTIPLLLIFLSELAIILIINSNYLMIFLFSLSIVSIIILTVTKIISKCDINHHKIILDKFIKNIGFYSKDLRYYSAYDYIFSKFEKDKKIILKNNKKAVSGSVWGSFLCVCLSFIAICLLYIIKEDYMSPYIIDISKIYLLFYSNVFFYAMFLISLLKYKQIRKIQNVSLKRYQNIVDISNDNDKDKKNVDNKNLFIAFHNVYFQLPASICDSSILNNLSFSVLPGEFIAITGDSIAFCECIFDLILKYYIPQSGNVYISGISTQNLNSSSIRSSIAFFKEDFSLVFGSIFENLNIVTNNKNDIFSIAEKVGLLENLNDNIFDENYEINISQDVLIRLQIARILIRNPSVLLVETPKKFISKESKELFYDFIKHFSKRKTVIISTSKPEFIIYADKVLYIKEDGKQLFGSHADLSKDKEYQRFFMNFKIVD